mgnify:CR=1 FL=1|jgi:hypothetical protein
MARPKGIDDIGRLIKGDLRSYIERAMKGAYVKGNTQKARADSIWWAKDAYKNKYGTTKGFKEAFDTAEKEFAGKRVQKSVRKPVKKSVKPVLSAARKPIKRK